MMVPIFYLILMSTRTRDVDARSALDIAYAGGLMVLAVLMIGTCLPAMILGWIRPDPEA